MGPLTRIGALVAILLLAMPGCCRLSPKHYVCLRNTPSEFTAESIDALIESADRVLEAKGYPGFKDTLRTPQPALVSWIDTETFDCGGYKVVGCATAGMVRVTYSWTKGCVARTALIHELVHIYLMRWGDATGGVENVPGSVKHTHPIWDHEPQWVITSSHELCGTELFNVGE